MFLGKALAPCHHLMFPPAWKSVGSLMFRQQRVRTLWWVEGTSGFGKAVADGWYFHMEEKCWLSDRPCRCSKCPPPPTHTLLQALFILEDVILRWLLQAQSLKDFIQKSHGGGTAPLFAVMVPCPSIVQASREAPPVGELEEPVQQNRMLALL